MLLFRSEEEVDAWCGATSEARGEVVPVAGVWALAQAWCGDRMDPAFRGRTAAQARAVFARVGLTSAFWQADAPGSHAIRIWPPRTRPPRHGSGTPSG
jgi:hypothetical protein